MKSFIRNHMFAIPLVSVLAIGISGSALMWDVTHPEQTPVAAPPAQASTVEWSKTPAADSIRAAITAVPKDWTPRGEQLTSVTPPFPLSCDIGGPQSSYSVSQQYNNGITVALASYTAGTGALAMKNQRDRSDDCVVNTAVSNVEESGLGSESFTIMVRRGAATSQTTVFRRGDVIGFVLVDGGASFGPAKAVDSAIATAMGTQCVNQESTVDDAKRTIWSGEPFTGLLKTTKATIDQRDVPAVPANAKYKATPVPAEIQQVKAVSLPEVPDYPVWPKLPESKTTPTLPSSPTAKPVVEKEIKIRIADEDGPGCGWNFTGTAAPVFNEQEINAANETLINNAEDELTKGAESWSKSVLSYWEAVDVYTKAVEEYEKFRGEVVKVNAAWEPIHAKWRTYYTDLADHEEAVKAKDDFIARKQAAQRSYDAAVKVCNAPEPVETKTPSPSPSPSVTKAPVPAPAPTVAPTIAPTPAPAPTVAPEESSELQMDRATLITPMVKDGCPAPRPSILDDETPKVPTAPEKPENPIPKDKR